MNRNLKRMCFMGLTVAVVGVALWFFAGGTRRHAPAPVPKDPFPSEIVIENSQIADAGFLLAFEYTGAITDPTSLGSLYDALEARGTGALAALHSELEKIESLPQPELKKVARLHADIGRIQTYLGRYEEALASTAEARREMESAGASSKEISHLTAVLGLVALRRGEVENCINCVGPSSCILPLAREAAHTRPAGSREAVRYFTEYLKEVPGDLRILWALNLAYMTLGEYPEKVPAGKLLPIDAWQSNVDVGRFSNVATLVGLTARGPNQAGGSVFDDFTGDGLPDLFITSLDIDRGASFYVNRGDGTFLEGSDDAELSDQIYALNVVRADFDNDGSLDLLLLRGGWEMPMRLSLLRNRGDGTFEDVTVAAGLADPIASESAAWGDYDNDGLVDLFVCGEYRSPWGGSNAPTPLNVCRLYHNEGNGRFTDVARAAGVDIQQCSKGSGWGDYDGDGWADLFVSNMNAHGMLFHNEKNGTFRDVGVETGVSGPNHGFACWFWDYDNDGRTDLYVNDYTCSLAEYVATLLKRTPPRSSRPRLYRNLGSSGFRDVTIEAGLDRVMLPMGSNFGDIDNDGFLDIYLGCGRMALEGLMPNTMFWNDGGKRFADVTFSSGTGHLQKGHGVSFADWDDDGGLDLFVAAGGAAPGDRAYNALFRNPGHGRKWLKVKLVGTSSNRAALGARIEAVIEDGDGGSRSVYRTIGNNGSFGGNSLVELIGLQDAHRVSELIVTWPSGPTIETFRDVAAGQQIEIVEGAGQIRPLARQVSLERIDSFR